MIAYVLVVIGISTVGFSCLNPRHTSYVPTTSSKNWMVFMVFVWCDGGFTLFFIAVGWDRSLLQASTATTFCRVFRRLFHLQFLYLCYLLDFIRRRELF